MFITSLAIDRGQLVGRAEAQHAPAPRDLLARGEEAATGEEEEELAEASMSGPLQSPRRGLGQRGRRGVGDELEALEHRVLPHERVVDARLQGDETKQRGAREGRRDQEGRPPVGQPPKLTIEDEPSAFSAGGCHGC